MIRLMRALLADGIPLAHPLPVLASLSQAAQQTTEHDRLVDLLRADLSPLLVGSICAPDEPLPVVTLAAELEEMIVNVMHDPASGQAAIKPDLARSIGERIASIAALRPQRGSTGADRSAPRAALAALLKLKAPGCAVLSINELPAAQPIEVIAVLGRMDEDAEMRRLPHEQPRRGWPRRELTGTMSARG